MDFSITEEQQMLYDLGAKITAEFDDTYFNQVIAEHRHPTEYIKRVAEHDLLGLTIAEEFGGAGLSMVSAALLTKALCTGSAGMFGGSVLINGAVFGGAIISRHGTDEQRARYLPGIRTGTLWAGAFTEANSGSNVSNIAVRAVREGDHYRVNGTKMWISNVEASQQILLLCRTSPMNPERKSEGVSLLVVDLPNDRIQRRPLEKMGNNHFDTNILFFDDVLVPVENRVGPEGGAWKALYDVLNPERVMIAASAVGTGNWVLERAVEQAKVRKVWNDKAIGSHQGVAFPLAEAKIHLECAWLKVMEAAWLTDQGDPRAASAATQAKYSAFHAALFAADRAIQTFGGQGYMLETGVERHFRDLRVGRIAPVPDELVLAYVAHHDLGLPRSY